MIYRGQDFLAVVRHGSSSTTPPMCKLDRRHTCSMTEKDRQLTWRGGEGVFEEQNHTTATPTLYKSSNTLWANHEENLKLKSNLS
jgi:hypothetical protein